MAISEIIRYVYITIVVATIFFIPIALIRYRMLQKQHKKRHWKYELANSCFIFYLLCLYQITALRLGGLGWNLENMLARKTRVNIEPLFFIWNWAVKGAWWYFFYNVIGNCAWFVPLGILMPAIYKGFRNRFWRVVFIGAVVSSSIEILQYVFCTGVTDMDDVICNSLGAAMGYGLWVIIDRVRKKINSKTESKLEDGEE